VALGLVAGFASGLLGVGGGAILVPALVAGFAMDQRAATAHSLVAIIPISIAGVLAYYYIGTGHHVRIDLAVALAFGGIIGAPAGARLTQLVSERQLRIGFAILLLLVAARLVLE